MKTLATSLASLGIALLTVVAASADDVVIAGGVRSGSYESYAVNLRSRLPAFRSTTRSTKGSGENLELLAAGKADIGFAQLDVYAALMRADPERFGKIGVIGRLSEECVFIAHRKKGRVTNVLDLQKSTDPKPKLAVGSPESGMYATWSFIQELDPEFRETAITFTEGTLAINHLATGIIDAVAWVTDPRNSDHKLRRAVQANDALGFLAFDDPDLVHELANGTRIYEVREVPVTSDFSPETIRTLCTASMIFTKADAKPTLVQAVSDVLSFHREAILELRPRRD